MIIHPFLINKGEKPPIPGTGHRVRFYDYDGRLLKTNYVETGGTAVPPTLPDYSVPTDDRPALVFQTWNNSLFNITEDTDLGAIYKTVDNKTYLYIELTKIIGLSPTLYINKTNTNTLTINWGDGTTETNNNSGNITLNHTYANYGKYKITISFSGYNVFWKIGHNTSETELFGNNSVYAASLKALYLGGNISTIQDYGLGHCYNLKKLTIPTLVSSFGIYCFRFCYSLKFFIGLSFATATPTGMMYNCYGLKQFIWSKVYTAMGVGTFTNCYSLEDIVLYTSLISVGDEAFYICRNLEKLTIPSTVTSVGALTFSEATKVKYYKFLSTTPPTLANSNAFTNINPLCKIYVPDESINAYKTATNWSVYADYIYPLSEFMEVE